MQQNHATTFKVLIYNAQNSFIVKNEIKIFISICYSSHNSPPPLPRPICCCCCIASACCCCCCRANACCCCKGIPPLPPTMLPPQPLLMMPFMRSIANTSSMVAPLHRRKSRCNCGPYAYIPPFYKYKSYRSCFWHN